MKVLHVIKTSRYESDGRLLKWIDSLKMSLSTSSVFIIEDKNESAEYTKDGVDIHAKHLWFRRIFKKHTGLLLKALEQGWKWSRFFRNSTAEIVVFHDVQQYLNIFISLCFSKTRSRFKLVWDLHELPHVELGANHVTKKWIRYLLSEVDLLVYTNEQRRQYILDMFGHIEKNYVVLNNFPDLEFIRAPRQRMPEDLNTWSKSQGSKPYLLWMGAASKGRYFDVVLNVFKKFQHQFNLVIMGRVETNFSNEIDSYIKEGKVFNRFVAQDEILGYVDNAHFSIVLYNSTKPNNMFCEPNRLYQLLVRNIPIICGNNPTMKNIVEKSGGGIVLPDDGRSLDAMEGAFKKMESNYNQYKDSRSSLENRDAMIWESQFKEVNKKLLEL